MGVKIILKIHLYSIESGFSMSTKLSFESIEISMLYRVKDYVKNFYESLRKHATKIIIFKKKKESY